MAQNMLWHEVGVRKIAKIAKICFDVRLHQGIVAAVVFVGN